MAKVKITGHASGSGVFTITAPNSNTDRTITLPDASVTLGTDATKLPLAGGTMTGDLILGDNVKLEVGSATGGDLQIYHDASNSYIDNQTGELRLKTSVFKFMNANNSETMISASENGAVNLYHDNAKKLETTAAGADVTGNLYASGGYLGLNTGDRIRFVDNTKSVIEVNGGEKLTILADGRATSGFTAAAWAKFSGMSTPSFSAQHNCSGITDNGTGNYRIAYTNALANADYAVTTANCAEGAWGETACVDQEATTYVQIHNVDEGGTYYDSSRIHFTVFEG